MHFLPLCKSPTAAFRCPSYRGIAPIRDLDRACVEIEDGCKTFISAHGYRNANFSEWQSAFLRAKVSNSIQKSFWSVLYLVSQLMSFRSNPTNRRGDATEDSAIRSSEKSTYVLV